jgi:hypothetical protein
MKIYINNRLLEVEWKSLMEPDMWYSMEPAILKIKKIHRNEYHSLLKDKKDNVSITVYKLKSDFTDKLDEYKAGLFDIEIILYYSKVVKRRRDGYLDIILNVCVKEMEQKDKSELRDILLETLIYS